MSESDAKGSQKVRLSGQHTPKENANNTDLKVVIEENSNRARATPDLFYSKNDKLNVMFIYLKFNLDPQW